ncbi:hypothetical protein VTP01DRAFT_480, partial [Rhizomucor pusillus]|uniref:uncharacterized protein n=1 Tax=Rhizomucor pusillus TaxID=4840 RepID=UPI003742DD5C
MFSFLGRGIFYLFIGAITLNYGGFSIACGVVLIVISIVYIILQFVPGIQAPSNMQKSAFEEALGYSTRPYNEGGANLNPVTPQYPQKTFVSDGPSV